MLVKVIEHVYEKVMNGGSEGGSGAGTPTGDRNQSDRETAESNSMAEDRVELLCNDTILDPNMDLRYLIGESLDSLAASAVLISPSCRTVKHFIWKSSSDLVLHYRPLR